MLKVLKFSGILFLTFVIGVFSYIFHDFLLPGYGAVLWQREASNGTFMVRVQMRPALYSFMQYYYVFQSAPANSNSWHQVARELRNEPKQISENHVRFVNDNIGYFFTDSICVVTNDGGQNWTTFNLKGSIFNRQNPEAYIRDVQITSDGTGTMLFNWTDQKLYTRDYGMDWAISP